MLAFELFTWWYKQGWSAAAKNIENMLTGISRLFSVPILLRTLFVPWKRIVTYPGAGLDTKLRAYVDNLVSRVIGFVVRLLVLLTACIMGVLVVVVGIVTVILWPLIPPGIILLIVKAITG